MTAALMLLGMHRSYTSLVARWLSECGLNMGETLLPDGIGNADGHFEDLAFFELHRRALRNAGLAENGMVDLRHPHFDRAALESLSDLGPMQQEARALLNARLAAGRPFGWKEPRTCLFLPFYRGHLNAFSLILHRPYQEVVGSLVSREPKAIRQYQYPGFKRPIYWIKRKSIEHATLELKHGFLESWIYYNTRLLEHIEHSDPACVLVHDLSSLTRQSSSVVQTLIRWGFPVEDMPLRAIVKPLSERELLDFDPGQVRRADEVTARFRALIERN
ncbi:MAG: hypothetical protein V2I27_10765 [Erythrobacter sp.]|jgi:hypothetical protein|nr:hypothetical protein [Erythrobacter sp.]